MPGLVHPTKQQQSAYIAAIQAISSKLAEQENRAISHGREICLDLFNDRKNNESITLSHEMARDNVDAATAKKITDAAHENFCPEPEFKPRS
jgi:hypothetical protein